MNDQIEAIIKEFFNKSPFIEGETSFSYDEKTHTIWVTLKTNDRRTFSPKNQDVLQAISTLIKRIVEHHFEKGEHPPLPGIIFDVNEIQKKRIENLRTKAHMLAERARFFKSSIDVEPMSPFDRRIVHEFLSEYTDIKTESMGEGMNRHIVIHYQPKETTI